MTYYDVTKSIISTAKQQYTQGPRTKRRLVREIRSRTISSASFLCAITPPETRSLVLLVPTSQQSRCSLNCESASMCYFSMLARTIAISFFFFFVLAFSKKNGQDCLRPQIVVLRYKIGLGIVSVYGWLEAVVNLRAAI